MPKWFGPSLDGTKACTPRSWQGWAATLVLIGALVGGRFLPLEKFGLPPWPRPLVDLCLVAAYALLVYLTYDPEL